MPIAAKDNHLLVVKNRSMPIACAWLAPLDPGDVDAVLVEEIQFTDLDIPRSPFLVPILITLMLVRLPQGSDLVLHGLGGWRMRNQILKVQRIEIELLHQDLPLHLVDLPVLELVHGAVDLVDLAGDVGFEHGAAV